jgi:hypothetical protein
MHGMGHKIESIRNATIADMKEQKCTSSVQGGNTQKRDSSVNS